MLKESNLVDTKKNNKFIKTYRFLIIFVKINNFCQRISKKMLKFHRKPLTTTDIYNRMIFSRGMIDSRNKKKNFLRRIHL